MAIMHHEAGPSASAHASTSSQGLEASSRFAHITNHSASLAIKDIDRHAFPALTAEETESLVAMQSPKRVRVADVDGAKQHNRSASLMSQEVLYRERARQRRHDRQRAREKLLQERKKGVKIFDAWMNISQEDASGSDAATRTYQPFSLPMLLDRLATFTISTCSNKPESLRLLSPLGMAMHGWKHDITQPRDRVICVTCSSSWSVSPQASAPLDDTKRQWAELEQGVHSNHKETCPWRLRSCLPSLYRVRLSSRLGTQAEIVRAASKMSQIRHIEDLDIETPDLGKDGVFDSTVAQALPRQALLLSIFQWKVEKPTPSIAECIVSCPFCGRRAGLWSFTKSSSSSKAFHVAREHKAYCPVVNGDVQSGKWLAEGKVDAVASVSERLPAWKVIARSLQASSGLSKGANDVGGVPNEESRPGFRNMRSKEVLSSIRQIVGGL